MAITEHTIVFLYNVLINNNVSPLFAKKKKEKEKYKAYCDLYNCADNCILFQNLTFFWLHSLEFQEEDSGLLMSWFSSNNMRATGSRL